MGSANQAPKDSSADKEFEAIKNEAKEQQESVKRMTQEIKRRHENAVYYDNDKINSIIQKIEKVSRKLEKTGLKLKREIERFDKSIAQCRRGPRDEDFERVMEELEKSKELLVIPLGSIVCVINCNKSLIKTLRKGLNKGNSVNNPAKVEQNLETRRKLKKTKSLLTSVNRFVAAVAKSVSRVFYRITS